MPETINEQAVAFLNELKKGNPGKKAIMLQVNKDSADRLKALADENNTSVANVIRIALKIAYNIDQKDSNYVGSSS